MHIHKFKDQHVDILRHVTNLRTLTQAGVAANAPLIAEGIIKMSAVIKLHLAVEDQALYPSLQRSDDTELVQLGRMYQDDMAPPGQSL